MPGAVRSRLSCNSVTADVTRVTPDVCLPAAPQGTEGKEQIPGDIRDLF